MVKVRVSYSIQANREIDVSEETVKFLDRVNDGNFNYTNDTEERAATDIVSKLQSFHPGQRIEVIEVRKV